MSAITSIELEWADGTYLFHLDIPRLKELQDKTGSGPSEVLARLAEGRARVEDIQETIRLGLIGGGTSPQAARVLVARYVDERPLIEGIAFATMILGAAIIGNKPAEPEEGNPPAAESPEMVATKPPETDA